MTNDNSTTTFITDSFILASYLLAESCHLVFIDNTDCKRMSFVFKESEQRKRLTEKFLSYKALIEPHRFYSAQKDLKQLIYQKKNDSERR